MNLSIFTHMTNPEERMDPWKECLDCYSFFSDDVFSVGGEWEEEFTWSKIGKVFHEGFEKAEGDWVLNIALDMFLHEKDKDRLLNYLEMYKEEPALALPKVKFYDPYRYQISNFETLLLNKRKYKDIKLNGGRDLCIPTLNGKILEVPNVKFIDIPLFNYDTTFRTKKIIAYDRGRFARAWFREFNTYGDRGGGTPEKAFEAWFSGVTERYKNHTSKFDIDSHPVFIKDKLKSLKKGQFGFDLFGLINNNFLLQNPKYYLRQTRIKQKYNLFNLI